MSTRTAGRILIAASVIGTLCASIIIAWQPEVAETRYSYPFGSTSYVVAQAIFALRDVATLLGLAGLAAVVWTRAGRGTRSGLVVTLMGMLLFAVAELFALTATHAAADSAIAGRVNAFYGLPMFIHGIGLVAAGSGLARSRLLPGMLGRWGVLAAGVYLFVSVFPAVFAPMVVGRIAIGTWYLIYAGIGVALTHQAQLARAMRTEAVAA